MQYWNIVLHMPRNGTSQHCIHTARRYGYLKSYITYDWLIEVDTSLFLSLDNWYIVADSYGAFSIHENLYGQICTVNPCVCVFHRDS